MLGAERALGREKKEAGETPAVRNAGEPEGRLEAGGTKWGAGDFQLDPVAT